ncbi:amidase family protein [Pseudoteredinibacter isoporae]|uniref:amidase family protein n=1 Tax=Pseudoteredinibacter isoporae TaxID=570281 RepID=UPI0031092E24
MREEPKLEQLRYFARTCSANALVSAYRAGICSPKDVSKAIQADFSVSSGVFTSSCVEMAEEAWTQSDLRHRLKRDLGPLDGVPIVIKDNFHLEGYVTSNGSAAMESEPATISSKFCRQLLSHGLIPMAKSTMSELAFSGVGINTVFGTPENVCSRTKRYIPGGSSSGSAAAVAQGLTPIAIGTDTSGSVRVPAAVQGVVGFRPSSGIHDISDILPLSPTLDTVGFFSRGVNDCLTIHTLLSDASSQNPDLQGPESIELLIPDHEVSNELDPRVKSKFSSLITSLRNGGLNIRVERQPQFEAVSELFSKYGTLVSYEAYENYGHLLSQSTSGLQEFTQRRLSKAGRLKASGKDKLLSIRSELIESLSTLPEHQFFMFPTVPVVPVEAQSVLNNIEFYERYNQRILGNTMLGSFLDMPGVSIPLKPPGGGLPFGLMLSSPRNRDDALLKVAKFIEKTLAGL